MRGMRTGYLKPPGSKSPTAWLGNRMFQSRRGKRTALEAVDTRSEAKLSLVFYLEVSLEGSILPINESDSVLESVFGKTQ